MGKAIQFSQKCSRRRVPEFAWRHGHRAPLPIARASSATHTQHMLITTLTQETHQKLENQKMERKKQGVEMTVHRGMFAFLTWGHSGF
jgi:hypothetical protein